MITHHQIIAVRGQSTNNSPDNSIEMLAGCSCSNHPVRRSPRLESRLKAITLSEPSLICLSHRSAWPLGHGKWLLKQDRHYLLMTRTPREPSLGNSRRREAGSEIVRDSRYNAMKAPPEPVRIKNPCWQGQIDQRI